MIDWTWLVLAGAVVGTVLNIYKNRYCFLFWAITNAIWAGVDFNAKLYAQTVQFTIFMFLAVWGWFNWGEK